MAHSPDHDIPAEPEEAEVRQEASSEEGGRSGRLDRLLGRYISVWLWSILFGTTVSVTFSLANLRPDFFESTTGFAVAVPQLFGLVLSLAGLSYLGRYLRRHIIPTFLHTDAENEAYPARREEGAPPDSYWLFRAFWYLVYALGLRVVAGITQMLVTALG